MYLDISLCLCSLETMSCWSGNSKSQKGHLASSQVVADFLHPLHAIALDWNKLKVLPQRGQVTRFVVFRRFGVTPSCLMCGVSTILASSASTEGYHDI